jgi:hypothetical protein
MRKQFALSDASAARLGMAAAGMLLGLLLAFVIAAALLLSGYAEPSLERSVLAGALIGIATGLVYPGAVSAVAQAVAHFSLGALFAANGQSSALAEESTPWLGAFARAGSLLAVATIVALWLFG